MRQTQNCQKTSLWQQQPRGVRWGGGRTKRDGTYVCAMFCSVTQSCLTVCDPMDCSPPVSSVCGDSPGKNTGVGNQSLLQGIFLTQESNRGLLHCRWILYQLSYKANRVFPWATREIWNICRSVADSCLCTAETNTILWSIYPSIKNK